MESINRTKFASEDVISSMPDNVVANVMDRLPLQDAVRTSILSRNWRFKWTMLRQLVFDGNFFEYLSVTKGVKNHGRIISRIFLQTNGAITKFILHSYSGLLVGDVDCWILFLSRKGIRDLTLVGDMNQAPLKLPTHLFSCLELKHLKLLNCCIKVPETFSGFPNLLSLEVDRLHACSKFEQLIAQCPAVEILKIGLQLTILNYGLRLQLVGIPKLANLKILSLPLCHLTHMSITNSNKIFELVGYFPKLEELDLDFVWCVARLTEEGGDAKKTLPTTFPCLKTLTLLNVASADSIMISCVFEMIRRFINLQTLNITATGYAATRTHANCFGEKNYNLMQLLKLQNVVFKNALENENEVGLIGYVLACSPFLREIAIHPHPQCSCVEKFVFAKKLLEFQRASTKAKVYIY